MSYTRTVWVNGQTAVDADNLNHGEGQYEAALADAKAYADSLPRGGDANAVPQLEGLLLACYGHSFGQQQNPWNTTTGALYPVRVSKGIKADSTRFQNRTVSGAKAADILTQAKATWNVGDYGVVTFMGNQNDVGARTTEATFKANVKGFIDYIRGPGEFFPTIVLVLDTTCTAAGYARYATPPTDADVARYNQYIRDVAAMYPDDGSIIIADAATGWDPNLMTGSDGQHPNDRGSAFIADAIVTALGGVGYREGQNVGFATPSYFFDPFNRPDNATTLGTNQYNAGYTVYGGSVYGVIGGQAYRPTGTTQESAAVRSTGKAAVDLTLTMAALSTKGAGPAWRLSDASNYWVVDIFGSGVGNGKVYKRVAGAFTQVGSALSVEVKAGSAVRVVHSGDTVTIYVDGTQAFTAVDSFNNTATQHGFRITEAGAVRIDNIVVK